ncbi:hypothetical protein [Leifsonia poae]
MTVALETRELTKVYKGKRALDSVSLTVEEGRSSAFSGPTARAKRRR